MGKRLQEFLEHSRGILLDPGTWKSFIAEVIGTSVLIAIGCGSCIGKDWETNNPTIVQISFTFGLTVSTMVTCIGHVSGGHINPAVTVAMMATRRMSPIKGFLYVLAQLTGAIIGGAILKAITPPHFEGDLGQTTISAELRPFPEAVVVEGLITFALVLTVFASSDGGRSDLGGSIPLGIGLCVVFCHLFAIKYTGSCLNPARSFGPAVVGGNWENHWVYWVGPILGAVVAGMGYELGLASDASIEKMRRLFTDPYYGANKPQRAEKDTLPMRVEQSESRDSAIQAESSKQF